MKIIILLPIVSMLGACSAFNTDFLKSNTTAPVEEKGVQAGNVSSQDPLALVQNSDLSAAADTSAEIRAEIRQATDELQANGVSLVLYFPYDDADISEENTAAIIEHANFMRDNPSFKLRLEGHADERGTREYNLALGENRALSIKEVLGLYDLASRVEVISFGEEEPKSTLHNEAAWQQNRRVEFIYQ